MTSKPRDEKTEDAKVDENARKKSNALQSSSSKPRSPSGCSSSSRKKLSTKEVDKVWAMRLSFATQMLIPDFALGCSVDVNRSLHLYNNDKLQGEAADIIPARSRCKVLGQLPTNKGICAVAFANKWGYISIAGDQDLYISPSLLAPTTVDKKLWPWTLNRNTQMTLNRCICKYEINPGTVMKIVFVTTLRKYPTDGADNPVVEELAPETSVVVLALHEQRFAYVRRLDPRAAAGWILAVDWNFLPALGYFIPEDDVLSSDIGERLNVLAKTQGFERGKDGDYAPRMQFEKGAAVRVVGTSPPDEEDVKVMIVPDGVSAQACYADFYNEKGPNFVPFVEGPAQPRVDAFMRCAKSNDVDGLRNMITSKHVDINVVDRTGKSAIFYALGFGNVEASLFLLQQERFNPHVADNCKRTALHYCCRRMPGTAVRDEIAMVKVLGQLLKLRPDVDAVDVLGNTPLMYAARENNMLLALRLLQSGADESLKTVDNVSARRIASDLRFKPLYNLLNSEGPR